MKVLTLNTVVAAVMMASGVSAAQADEAKDAPMQVYTYVYSAERAAGSLYHSFDSAAYDITQQAGAAAKAASIAAINDGYSSLQQQFAYVIYVPKKPQTQETIDWRGFA